MPEDRGRRTGLAAVLQILVVVGLLLAIMGADANLGSLYHGSDTWIIMQDRANLHQRARSQAGS